MPDNRPVSGLARFMGGSPWRVGLQLAVISIAVGLVMSTLRIDPLRVFDHVWFWIQDLIDYIRWAGIDLVESVVRWLAYGAIVVVPVWVILRLGRMRREP
jgi:hypothetical protein